MTPTRLSKIEISNLWLINFYGGATNITPDEYLNYSLATFDLDAAVRARQSTMESQVSERARLRASATPRKRAIAVPAARLTSPLPRT